MHNSKRDVVPEQCRTREMWPIGYNVWDQKRSWYVNSEKSCFSSPAAAVGWWTPVVSDGMWFPVICHERDSELLYLNHLWNWFVLGKLNSKFSAGIQFTILHICVLWSQKGHPGAKAPSPPVALSNLSQQKKFRKWGKWKPTSSWTFSQPWYLWTSWLGYCFQNFMFNNTYGSVLQEVEPHAHFDLHSIIQ